MERLIIKGGRILDPSQGIDEHMDIFIEDGIIKAMGESFDTKSCDVIDANGLCVAPGFIDIHVHFRDPGFTHKEDISSGCESAAAGGFTSVCCMPNTKPVIDNVQTIKYILDKSKNEKAKVYPIAAVSKGLCGKEMTDFAELKKAGAIALSDDGRPIANPKMLLSALSGADKNKMCLTCHCEDLQIINGGIMNKGEVSEKLGVKGMDRLSEDVSTAEHIALAQALGVPVHIAHVSTKGSAQIIRNAKKRGVKVTAETAPHYLILDETKLLRKDANFRMNPPLRTKSDVKAMQEAVLDGTIDVIATDHAPHSEEEKADFLTSPNGIVGLETSFAVSNTVLVKQLGMPLIDLVNMMSTRPAKIMGIEGGTLEIGKPADIVIFSQDEEWVVEKSKLHSKSKNTPFHNEELTGKVKLTLLNGKITYNDEN